MTSLVRVDGTISSAAFAGGHRFVVGRWDTSPVGPLVDVMWATPDDRRILLTPSRAGADFITSIYDFDEVRVDQLSVLGDRKQTLVSSEELSIVLTAGCGRPVPLPRPRWVTRFIEAPIARRVMGVNAYGVSPTGAREWYQTRGWRWVSGGNALLAGVDLGAPLPITRPLRVGFSEPPRQPSIVAVKVTIELPG